MYQDGQTATNPQTGEKVVLRGGQWVSASQTAPAPKQQTPAFVPGVPRVDPAEQERIDLARRADRRAQQDQDRQNTLAPYQVQSAQAAVDTAQDRKRQTELGQANKLRDDYNQSPVVKSYQAMLPSYIAGINSAPTPAGDLDLIYAYAKIMDPNSVVREGEAATVAGGDTWAGQTIAQLRKQLAGDGTFRPEYRAQLREEMKRRGAAMNEQFIQERVRYKTMAERYGVNPMDIVGEHPGGTFKEDEARAFGTNLPPTLDFYGKPAPPGQGGNPPRGPAPDEGVYFQGEDKPITGYRLAPEQEGQIADAIAVGDEGQAIALLQRFSGNPPTPETIQSVRAAIKNKGKISFNYGAVDRTAQEQADFERYGNNLKPAMEARKGDTVDAAVRGIADTGSFGLADELAAGATTLFSGGTMKENLQKERAIDEADRRVNSAARFGGQIAGGFLNPIGRGANTVPEIAKAGTIAGGLYGAGSGTDPASRGVGALSGGIAGGIAGAAVGKASELGAPIVKNALTRFAKPNEAQAERNALLQAADRQSVELMPADVGGAGVRGTTAAAAQAPLSSGPISNAAKRTVDQTRAARDRIATGTGKVLDQEAAGDLGRVGGERFITKTRQQADRYYTRAEKMAGDAKITPTQTTATLDRHIAELQQDPSAGTHLAALQKLREAIGNGQLTVAGIRSMRSRLRQQFLDDGLRSSDFQRRVGEVVDSASEDLVSNLTEQGLGNAATAFKRADSFYRGRVEAIDEFLQPIIGKGKSGEDVMRALEGAAKGNGRRLQGFMSSLPPEERAGVQATIISRMGVKRGDAEASDFSLDVFLTQWKAMTPRAKAALFPGDARSGLDDLVKIAEASKAARANSNRSNTAGGVMGNIGLYAGWASLDPVSAALAGITQIGAGKLLASPGFARWLARAPKSANPEAAKSWASRIPAIAAQNPGLRAEVEQFQRQLLSSLSQSPTRAAADEKKADRRPKPVN